LRDVKSLRFVDARN